MKTIEEAVKNYARTNDGITIQPLTDGFLAGVDFAQRWYGINDKKPTDTDLIFITKLGKCSIGKFEFIESKLCITTETGYSLVEDSLFTHFRPIELK